MAHFNLDNYETVEERLVRWWEAYPNAEIITKMLHYDAKTVVFSAIGMVDGRTISTGHAEEVLGSSPVNKTSFVENCETSAIGRMIANSPLGTKQGARPSRQEMQKVNSRTPVQTVSSDNTSEAVQTIVKEFNATVVKNVNDPSSPKQIGMIRAILRGKGLANEEMLEICSSYAGRELSKVEDLSKGEASHIITMEKG